MLCSRSEMGGRRKAINFHRKINGLGLVQMDQDQMGVLASPSQEAKTW
jgi:hypothetical protein